jgi:hypothetical protein
MKKILNGLRQTLTGNLTSIQGKVENETLGNRD